jgi:hypothetical protein
MRAKRAVTILAEIEIMREAPKYVANIKNDLA